MKRPKDEYGIFSKLLDFVYVLSSSVDNLISNFDFPPANFIRIDLDGLEGDIIRGIGIMLERGSFKSVLVEISFLKN